MERLPPVQSMGSTSKLLFKETRNLTKMIFVREDLYHRLKVFTIELPPLRERGKDKVILAQCFFKKVKAEGDWSCKGFTREALDAIHHHGWPGNVREMINRVRRALVVQDGWIEPEDLELSVAETVAQSPRLQRVGADLKKKAIESALREHRCNITHAAKSMGISRSYLHLLIKQLSVSMDRQKPSPGKP